MSSGAIHLELSDSTATVVIDRPEKRNALTQSMRAQKLDILNRITVNPDISVIIITGVDNSFCAGGDLNSLAALRENDDEAGFINLLDDGKAIVNHLRETSKPVIAAVNGPALGAGLFIALGCDIRLCSESATFGVPLVHVGLGPDWGGTYALPRIAGQAIAAEMCFAGRVLTATEAVQYGIANHVYPADQLMTEARKLARQLAEYPPDLLARYKLALRSTWELTYSETADLERRLQLKNFHAPDFAPRLTTLLQKSAM